MIPAATTLVADQGLRRRDRGRLLIGGSPLRFIRVTDAGARVVSAFLRGEPVGTGNGRTALAERLVAAGMLHPVPGGDGPISTMAVVIPVKDDQPGLDRTLRGLGVVDGLEVVVVDDGSVAPVRLPATSTHVRLVRRPTAGGPGVARQTGLDELAASDPALVAFVDAGVAVEADDLRRLERWFVDPAIVAVGPRVASEEGRHLVARYETHRSPLDLGPTPAAVHRQSPVTYLPTACLVARRAVVAEVGGFDADLRWGEDVDLIWRLAEKGTVRYDPTVRVTHPPRPSVRRLIDQRMAYGSAAGPLARRHPDRLAPVRVSGWSVACWALVAAGRPLAAAVLVAGTAVALRRKLAPVLPDPGAEAAMLAPTGHLHAGRSLCASALRALWPVSAVALAVGGPVRRAAIRVIGLAVIDRLVTGPGRGPDRATMALLGVVDDLSYGTGVWLGAIGQRTVDPLLPRLVEWPPPDGAS